MYPYYQFSNYYQQASTPTLPQQQIIQVNGKDSVDTIQLAPNSSLLAMDTTAPIVWMCVSDGVGKVSSTPYDIKLHKDKPPIDVENIESRISKVEKFISEWEEKINVKQSNADSFNAKQNSAKCPTSPTAHADH